VQPNPTASSSSEVLELADDEARLVDMLRKVEKSQAEPVPAEIRTCVSDIIARLECPAILKQHDPQAANPRSRLAGGKQEAIRRLNDPETTAGKARYEPVPVCWR
jgi:hypothetical protein